MQQTLNIVLLTGAARSGKTTVALAMKKYGYLRVRFAEPLKKMLIFGFGLTVDEVDGHLKEQPCDKLCGATPRWAMQSLGTEWGRNIINPNLWNRAWQQSVRDAAIGNTNIVADDCRFHNELAAAKELGKVTVVRLLRDGAGIPGDHVSEQSIYLPYDYMLFNNGAVEDTARDVHRMSKCEYRWPA